MGSLPTSGVSALTGVVFVLVVFLGGCASRGGDGLPAIGEGPVVLMTPHWDQVCRDRRERPFITRPGEILELEALVERIEGLMPGSSRFAGGTVPTPGGYPAAGRAGPDLDAVGARHAYAPEGALPEPAPRGSSEVAPWVDVAVSYASSGELRTAHLLGHTLDPAEADAVAGAVIEAVRPLGRLLEPVFLRIRAMRTPDVELRILLALSCMPHITHEEEEPPRFLGDVRVRGGLRFGSGGNDRVVSVRLHIARSGSLEEVEVVGGNEALLPGVRESLTGIEFDPALLNGEPVPGLLNLVFTFPDPGVGDDERYGGVSDEDPGR